LGLARLSLSLTALVYAGFGFAFLVWPALITWAGVELTSPAAHTEIRAFYGGLEIGLALFFVLAATRRAWFRPGLVAQAASLGGLALGRVFGVIVDGEPEPLLYLLITAETIGALIGLVALRRLGAADHAGSIVQRTS
jgi:hypothetical protein